MSFFLFFSLCISRVKDYLLSASKIFSFGQTRRMLYFWFSPMGGWAGRGHPSLPIWKHYCELYLLTGNLARLIFFLGNKTLPSIFTYKTSWQPGGTYIISFVNNEYIF